MGSRCVEDTILFLIVIGMWRSPLCKGWGKGAIIFDNRKTLSVVLVFSDCRVCCAISSYKGVS